MKKYSFTEAKELIDKEIGFMSDTMWNHYTLLKDTRNADLKESMEQKFEKDFKVKMVVCRNAVRSVIDNSRAIKMPEDKVDQTKKLISLVQNEKTTRKINIHIADYVDGVFNQEVKEFEKELIQEQIDINQKEKEAEQLKV
jgi:hypothetical protein